MVDETRVCAARSREGKFIENPLDGRWFAAQQVEWWRGETAISRDIRQDLGRVGLQIERDHRDSDVIELFERE